MNEQTANDAAINSPQPQPMPAVLEAQPKSQPSPETHTQPTAKKVFTRKDVKRFVKVSLVLPFLYEEYEPWSFKFRFALSKQMDEQKQDFLSMSAMEQTQKDFSQSLDEVCDLLLELPTGFGDLNPEGAAVVNPGAMFRAYVEETTDPEAREQIQAIIKGAANQYWTVIAPRAFRG